MSSCSTATLLVPFSVQAPFLSSPSLFPFPGSIAPIYYPLIRALLSSTTPLPRHCCLFSPHYSPTWAMSPFFIYSYARTLLSFMIPIPGHYCPPLFPYRDIIVFHSSPIWTLLSSLLSISGHYRSSSYLGIITPPTIHIRALSLPYYPLGTTAPYYFLSRIITLIIHIEALLLSY
jgi:hypothetical protein